MRCRLGDVCIVTGCPEFNGMICTTLKLLPEGAVVFDLSTNKLALAARALWATDQERHGRRLGFFDNELTPLPKLREPEKMETPVHVELPS